MDSFSFLTLVPPRFFCQNCSRPYVHTREKDRKKKKKRKNTATQYNVGREIDFRDEQHAYADA